MDVNIAIKICDAASDLALDGFKMKENYTGRGKFKIDTAAIVFDNMNSLIAAIAHASGLLNGSDSADVVSYDEFIDSIIDLSFDSIDCSQIVY